MTCRYVGLVAWAGVAAALALVAHMSEPRQTGNFVARVEHGTARRRLQPRENVPVCFKTDNCRHMNYANAVDHCETLGGHLCTADELQTYTFNGRDEDDCSSEFAERAAWASAAPTGLGMCRAFPFLTHSLIHN